MQTQREMKEKLEALQSKASVRILAMESSCDETAATVPHTSSVEAALTQPLTVTMWSRKF